MSEAKQCKDCQQSFPKTSEYFFKATHGFQAQCKPCYAARKRGRYVHSHKKSALELMPHEQRLAILQAVDRGESCIAIAQEHGVNYHTIRYWKKSGVIDRVRPQVAIPAQ